MDGAKTKAPLGGKHRPNPTDRGKDGVTRSLLTEGQGVPIGLTVDSANRHAMQLVRTTIASIVVERPDPAAEQPHGTGLDKGYNVQQVLAILTAFGFTAHIRVRCAESQALKREAGFRARRWVGESTHSWLNRFRRILVSWQNKPENDAAFLYFARALIAFRASRLFG